MREFAGVQFQPAGKVMRKATLYSALRRSSCRSGFLCLRRRVCLPEWLPLPPAALQLPEWLPLPPAALQLPEMLPLPPAALQLPEMLPLPPAALQLPEWLPLPPAADDPPVFPAVLRVVFLLFVTFHQRKRGKCACFLCKREGVFGSRRQCPRDRAPLSRESPRVLNVGVSKNRENHANKRGGYHGEYLSALYK